MSLNDVFVVCCEENTDGLLNDVLAVDEVATVLVSFWWKERAISRVGFLKVPCTVGSWGTWNRSKDCFLVVLVNFGELSEGFEPSDGRFLGLDRLASRRCADAVDLVGEGGV